MTSTNGQQPLGCLRGTAGGIDPVGVVGVDAAGKEGGVPELPAA